MTVFLAHAPADRSAAEALEKVIERRGQFVELDDGVTALRPVQHGDVLVLLVSQALMFATARLRLEQRALDAWADGRLIVVRLDKGLAPVGLRDLPAIDASFEAQREFKWNEVADGVRQKLQAARQAAPAAPARKAPRPPWRLLVSAALLAAAAAGVWGVVSSLISPHYACSIQAPDILDRVRIPSVRCVNTDAAVIGVPDVVLSGWAAIAVVGALVVAGLLLVWAAFARRAPRAAPAPLEAAEAPAPPTGSAVFVSYARANEGLVLPVIEAAKRAGRKFWLDQKGGVSAGDGWAGEIVRAIRGSASVVVMCSKAAFESDHVKREIYLADRYRKKLAPVFIEAAEPPEDFEYFFAGVQPLKLFETPEAERPEALIRVLGVPS
jgi:hypothetical protein